MNIKTTKNEIFQLGEVIKPTAKTVSILITVDVFNENTAKESALNLLYSDLLLAGAGKFSRTEFSHLIDELGSSIDVSASLGRINITVGSLAEKLKPTLKLLETMLLSPSFKSVERARVVRTLKNTLELNKENARALALLGLKNSLFTKKNRQYSFSPDELISVVDEIKIEDLKKLHQNLLNSFWTVSVGGNEKSVTETLQFIKKIKKTTQTIAKEPVETLVSYVGRQVLIKEVKSKQNIEVSIGASLPLTLTDEELPAFIFGLAVLGMWGGFAGRLMSIVRAKEGLTYMIYARTEGISVTENGYWRITSFFSPKDVIKGLTSTLREINTIQQKGISASELERFRIILKTNETLIFDSLLSTTNHVHGKIVSGLSWNEYVDFRDKIYNCSRSQVNAVLKKYLSSENITISVAGPTSSVEKDLQHLGKM